MPQNKIIVLAGGASVASYNLDGISKRGSVIGVNHSFIKCPECLCGLTMDRAWMEANVDKVLKSGKPFFVRHAAVKYIGDKIFNIENIRLYDCDETNEMSTDPDKLNGTSSGMVALNLALQLNPDIIYLLGFDMQGDRWYKYDFKNWEPKGDKFTKWRAQFGEIALKTKVKIVNVNHQSALKCFPTITYEEFCRDTEADG
jgi:hypothetical protein